jgi:hypothetical protein
MNNHSTPPAHPAAAKKPRPPSVAPAGGNGSGRSGLIIPIIGLINAAVLVFCLLIYLQQAELVEEVRADAEAEAAAQAQAAMRSAQQLIDELLLSARNASGAVPPNPAPDLAMKVLTGPNAGKVVGIQRPFMTFGTPGTHGVMAISQRGDGYVAFHLQDGPNGERATLDGAPLASKATKINAGAIAEVAGVRVQFLTGKN